ncbi:MAG: hypothetical protein OK449_02800 [Thaumarchaeota archaeon]|nr:hypothetical protein [Nitrososphaerota archaeon]
MNLKFMSTAMLSGSPYATAKFLSHPGGRFSMITVDCSELSADEKLALASEISDSLEGKAIALVKMDSIVLDQLTDEKVDIEAMRPIVRDFISRRKDSAHYSFEANGDTILVHSADPMAASHRKTENTLPPNLKQCPYCSFITQYEVEYTVHMRSHLFGV